MELQAWVKKVDRAGLKGSIYNVSQFLLVCVW